MKKIIYLVLVLATSACTGQKQKESKAEVTFNNHIKVVEKYLEGETIKGTGLDDSVVFLEELTSIKSNIFEGVDKLLDPTEKDLKDWKDWYKKNKHLMYWDEKGQKVKLKDN